MRRRLTARAGAIACALIVALLAGCGGSYTLRGRVVEGAFSSLNFVGVGAEQVAGDGIPYAEITIFRDPNRPNMRMVASGRSDAEGEFDIAITGFGAGWMVEEWLVHVVRQGYESLEWQTTLPGSSKKSRMHVVLKKGLSVEPYKRDDPWEDYERYR